MAKKELKEEKKEETKEVKKEKISNIHEVEAKIDGNAWKNAIDKAFLKKQKTVKVDGFRQGKVPRSIFEKRFGKESLYMDAADSVIEEAYHKALTSSKLEPVVKPSVDLKEINDKECVFVFKITTQPIVNIKKYKGLNVKPKKVEVTEEEINHELEHTIERFTELVTKDKDAKIENGDVAIIDFEGFKDGKAFDGGKGENYSLEIGSNTFIPGFEEKMIGMKAEEERDLELKFPEDYGAKDLAGKDVVFKVKVHEIKTKEKRKLDEDFFEDLGIEGVDTEAKLKKHIKDSIAKEKEVQNENEYVDELLETVAKNVEVDIPEEIVEEEQDRLMHRFEDQVRSQGLSLDIYYHFANTTEEETRSKFEKDAYNNVLYRLMLEELVKKENVDATDEETDKEAEDMAKKYNMKKADLIKQIGGLEFIKYDLKIKKVIDLLKEYNK